MNKTQKRALARDASRLLDFFGDGSKWTKGTAARKIDTNPTCAMVPAYDANGVRIGFLRNPEATCFCLSGAMMVLEIDTTPFQQAADSSSIVSFNDDPMTTFTTVRRWLKRLVKAGS